MKSQKSTAILLIVALALALFPGASRAQRLYNKERDQRAQTALPPTPLRPGKTSGDLNSLCLIAYRLTTPSVLQPRLNV